MENKKKLKFICPIWKDPLGWSRWVAGNKLFLSIAILFHAIIAIGMVLTVYFDLGKEIEVDNIAFLAFVVFLFLSLYAYALYRLIKIIDHS